MIRTLAHWGWLGWQMDCKMVITLGKGLGVPTLSKLHTQLLFDPTILFVDIYLRDMLTYAGKDLYRNIYSNFIHKTQSEKTKCPSTRKDKPWDSHIV